MSLKDLREGRINSRDKRKGRNIFVAAIEFLTKNKRIEETGRAAGSCCGCWERVLANESERGRDGCRPEGQRDGGTRLRKIRSEPSGASLVRRPTAASSTSTTCLCGRDDALDDLWRWRILRSRLG